MERVKGFTLVELMVTVAVLAILVALAGPSLADMLRKNRAQAEVNTIKSMFNYARSEAVQRSGQVYVCTPDAGDWSVRTGSCNGTELRRFSQPTVATVTKSNIPAAGLIFDARGYLANVTLAANRPAYSLSVTNACELNRIIQIQPIGSVAISAGSCPA